VIHHRIIPILCYHFLQSKLDRVMSANRCEIFHVTACYYDKSNDKMLSDKRKNNKDVEKRKKNEGR